jgi:transposase-like protein
MNNVSLKNFYKRFPNEEACLVYLEHLRWPDTRACPHCGSTKTYKYANGKTFKCASCRKQFTVMVGTVFMQSHVPLQDWFLAVLLSGPQGRGITSVKLAEYLEVTQKTAWTMLRRIRYGLSCSEDENGAAKLRAGSFEIDDMLDEVIQILTTVVLPSGPHV